MLSSLRIKIEFYRVGENLYTAKKTIERPIKGFWNFWDKSGKKMDEKRSFVVCNVDCFMV